MRVGSLFSGCGGLDLGLELAGFEIAWAAEIDPACRRVLARQRPELHVLEDVREVDDWMPEVDVLAGGFPCQDLSYANGRGAGLDGDRSALWFVFADAIRLLRPRLVLVENVPGLATRGLGRVVYDLAEAGYVGQWLRLRAADVGAPHQRERIFIVAEAADSAGAGREGTRAAPTDEGGQREAEERGRVRSPLGDPEPSSDAGRPRHRSDTGAAPGDEGGATGRAEDEDHVAGGARPDRLRAAGGAAPADPRSLAGAETGERATGSRAGSVEAARGGAQGRPLDRVAGRAGADPSAGGGEWGEYAPAIHRWERLLGRAAPAPVDDRGRLSPNFVEWMLGYPDGWTEGETATQRLRMLGNSVQVQCGALAGQLLVERVTLPRSGT